MLYTTIIATGGFELTINRTNSYPAVLTKLKLCCGKQFSLLYPTYYPRNTYPIKPKTPTTKVSYQYNSSRRIFE